MRRLSRGPLFAYRRSERQIKQSVGLHNAEPPNTFVSLFRPSYSLWRTSNPGEQRHYAQTYTGSDKIHKATKSEYFRITNKEVPDRALGESWRYGRYKNDIKS